MVVRNFFDECIFSFTDCRICTQLNGKPFWSDSTDGIDSKLLICALLAMLQKKGFVTMIYYNS